MIDSGDPPASDLDLGLDRIVNLYGPPNTSSPATSNSNEITTTTLPRHDRLGSHTRLSHGAPPPPPLPLFATPPLPLHAPYPFLFPDSSTAPASFPYKPEYETKRPSTLDPEQDRRQGVGPMGERELGRRRVVLGQEGVGCGLEPRQVWDLGSAET